MSPPIAEARNDWVDEDGDDMLDGFSNGGYDWVDINGGDWIRLVALMDIGVLVTTAAAFLALRTTSAGLEDSSL